MSKLKKLIESILRENKMTAEALVNHLAEALCECSCGEVAKEYRYLYEDAYGTKITKELAESWVRSMSSPDGEGGQKWSMDSAYEYGNKVSMDWNKHSKTDFYIVMNMMYSDCYKTAKAINMQDDPMFFARLARDWLCDADAPDDKLYRYYFEVVA